MSICRDSAIWLVLRPKPTNSNTCNSRSDRRSLIVLPAVVGEAIFEAMKYVRTGGVGHVYKAALLIPLALVFDVFDGRVARVREMAHGPGAAR